MGDVPARGRVVMLPGADRPEDALKYLHEALAGGARGIVIFAVGEDGRDDVRQFGSVLRQELAWAALVLQDGAISD